MALRLAAVRSGVFAEVLAWASITDQAKWHAKNKLRSLTFAPPGKYSKKMENAFGIPPADPQAVVISKGRSPLCNFSIASSKKVKMDINAGITDKNHEVVPVDYSLQMFKLLKASPSDCISSKKLIARNADKPDKLPTRVLCPTYGTKLVLTRKTSGKILITIYAGEHKLIL